MISNFTSSNRKEITIIVLSFLLLALFSIGSKFYEMYNIKKLNQMTNNIYEHPLRVTNAALNVKLDIIKIHRDINDTLLLGEILEFNSMILHIDKIEKRILENLTIIENNIIGSEGKRLLNNTKILVIQWKEIRNILIGYSINNQKKQAEEYSKWESAIHVLRLEEMTTKLYNHAQFKATGFKNNSQKILHQAQNIDYILTILFIFLFILIAYYVIKRIYNYVFLLEKNKKELESILNESPYPIMVYTVDGDIILLNKIWEKTTGYDFNEINTIKKWNQKAYGKELNSIKKENRSINLNNESVMLDNIISDGEFKVKTKNDKTLIWEFSSSYLGKINNKHSFVSSAVDITELKAKDKLIISQSRHAAMGEMISMIAHQWRQPITAISMIANNILLDIELEEVSNEDFEAYSKSILVQTTHLSHTIDDFRNFFKQDKDISEENVNDIITNVLNIIGNTLENNSIKLINNSTSKSKIKVYARELGQVIINIINNSKDVLIERDIKNRVIKIDISDGNGYVDISISDNGKGINEEIIDRIFEPYFTTKDKNGTGLGLYMSKMIVEEHLNGALIVENIKDGVHFLIKLPVYR